MKYFRLSGVFVSLSNSSFAASSPACMFVPPLCFWVNSASIWSYCFSRSRNPDECPVRLNCTTPTFTFASVAATFSRSAVRSANAASFVFENDDLSRTNTTSVVSFSSAAGTDSVTWDTYPSPFFSSCVAVFDSSTLTGSALPCPACPEGSAASPVSGVIDSTVATARISTSAFRARQPRFLLFPVLFIRITPPFRAASCCGALLSIRGEPFAYLGILSRHSTSGVLSHPVFPFHRMFRISRKHADFDVRQDFTIIIHTAIRTVNPISPIPQPAHSPP